MVRHDSGVDLLLAPPTPEAAELVSGEQHHLLRVVEVLRTMYDYVIVDMEKRLDDSMLDVIGAADKLVVVLTADLSCLKNVRLVLETMGQLGVPDERLALVLNRANAFTGISAKSVESVLKTQIAQQIINDYRSRRSRRSTRVRRSWPTSPIRRSGARCWSWLAASTSRQRSASRSSELELAGDADAALLRRRGQRSRVIAPLSARLTGSQSPR